MKPHTKEIMCAAMYDPLNRFGEKESLIKLIDGFRDLLLEEQLNGIPKYIVLEIDQEINNQDQVIIRLQAKF